MTTKNTGGPAFPRVWDDMGHLPDGGMTLRDYFAAQALSGVIQSCGCDGFLGTVSLTAEQYFAEKAFALADAMLAEREK